MKKGCFLKKSISLILCILLLPCLWAQAIQWPMQITPQNLEHYTLENGLSVYLLEDSSAALVRIEFTCRAGFSLQDQSNAGFFKLYSQLFKQATPSLNFETAECNADTSRYVVNVPATKVSDVLETLSNAAFSLFYTDELLAEQLAAMKNEVQENANSLAGFINSAIDSRIFANQPWKHDSGIYPALFKSTTSKQARTILKEISDKYYTPQNSAIFISGNINSEKLNVTLKNTFGRYYSSFSPNTKDTQTANITQPQRKFVLHHNDFSPELTQVVVQYTMLGMTQAEILAKTFNMPSSTFKQNVLSKPELNIPGDEYINISSAHKSDSNRLIFQTLIQPPENKKIKTNSLKQSEIFLNEIKNAVINLTTQDLNNAVFLHQNELKTITTDSRITMDYLSTLWGIEPFILSSQTDLPELQLTYTNENPYVFVIINSRDYIKNKKEFDAAGYKEVTTENASWYVQEMYHEIRDQFKPEEKQYYNITNEQDNNYYQKNVSQIKTSQLSNGIQVSAKYNDFSDFVTMAISIKGGKLYSPKNNGFEDAMVYLLSLIIQEEIFAKQMQGIILGSPEITSKTEIATSTIFITCEKEDFVAVCNAVSSAIIYGSVKPADADRAVSSRQYRKRLENGSASNQLQSAAMETLFGKGEFAALFDTKKDILKDTTYTSILESYSELLDCTRYSIILCGNFYQNYIETLNSTLGMLSPNTLYNQPQLPQMTFPKNKSQQIKIVHTFLTDIPAELAGPQPAVLIPTTEFKDPVLYVLKTPEQGTKEAAIFNACVNYLVKQIQSEIDSNRRLKGATVSAQFARFGIQADFITLQNVERTKEADAAYRNAVRKLKNQIETPGAEKSIIVDIKNLWALQQMEKTATNAGTAELMQRGTELFPNTPDSSFYLTEYNYIQTATIQDFRDVIPLLPDFAAYRVYSVESK